MGQVVPGPPLADPRPPLKFQKNSTPEKYIT